MSGRHLGPARRCSAGFQSVSKSLTKKVWTPTANRGVCLTVHRRQIAVLPSRRISGDNDQRGPGLFPRAARRQDRSPCSGSVQPASELARTHVSATRPEGASKLYDAGGFQAYLDTRVVFADHVERGQGPRTRSARQQSPRLYIAPDKRIAANVRDAEAFRGTAFPTPPSAR